MVDMLALAYQVLCMLACVSHFDRLCCACGTAIPDTLGCSTTTFSYKYICGTKEKHTKGKYNGMALLKHNGKEKDSPASNIWKAF